ncbi:hypothetical protein TEA_021699 [Camellia sinensis var. sinensis]|uniref:CCHC-type domain-containing protein n=1 Tax=Camellia sinensis var. sinensis TaxID=542762 RepID=A0A4S4E7W3_CAMSN|nr:hypothetical protein TEA_021699 [Camellia sinensis var. sinensis]
MVTLKASYMVKPAKETPTRLMYLSEYDQFDTITHSPTVYFYQHSGELILNAIIHTLKDSLSKALIMFYPLAGRLARGRLQYGHSMKCGGKSGKWSILYWKDSSLADSNRMNWVVPVLTKEPAGSNKMNNNAHVSNVDKPKGFIEAESSQKPGAPLGVSQPSQAQFHSTGQEQYRFGRLAGQIARASVESSSQAPVGEVCSCSRCGQRGHASGSCPCLGLGISHILVDGECAAHFICKWARIAHGKKPENFPFLDRTILQLEDSLPKTSFDISDFNPPPLLIGHSNNTEERNKKTVVAMLKLNKEQINKSKNKANEYRNSDTSTNRAFTRYESVTAHMWRCACKARQHESKQLTNIRIPVNFRNRLQPPLPKWYFGCTVLPIVTTPTSGDIVSKPLSYTAKKLREVIEKVTDKYIRSCFVFLKNEPDLSKFRYFHIVGSNQGPFYGNPNICITDWTRLPLYGVDFGWGKEIYMVPGAIGYDGKASILPGHDEDGSFLFLIPWRLQETHMDAFKKFFYNDI